MISPVTASATIAATQAAVQPSSPAKASAAAGNSIPQDTVTLSSAAQHAAPAGDVDHDGDNR